MQIRPELLHTDREFEQLKEGFFAHVNAALGRYYCFTVSSTVSSYDYRPEFKAETLKIDFPISPAVNALIFWGANVLLMKDSHRAFSISETVIC